MANFVKSILGGLSISLAATLYLSTSNSVVGGMLFSVGLLAIYIFGWNLYTGKACSFVNDPKGMTPVIINSFFGNLVGTFLTGAAIRLSGLSVAEYAVESVIKKLSNSYIEYFILAIFCGIAMSIAVLGYKKQKDDFGRFIIILLPITLFIVAKFEHVVANMFYISLANEWNFDSVIFLIICAIGNLLGCSVIPFLNIIIEKNTIEKNATT